MPPKNALATPTDMSGPHFRDYHLMLDEQATQILATNPKPARFNRPARDAYPENPG
ncbi:hypothetical protein ABTU92_17600 [Rhodoplanes sp. SY1]